MYKELVKLKPFYKKDPKRLEDQRNLPLEKKDVQNIWQIAQEKQNSRKKTLCLILFGITLILSNVVGFGQKSHF